MDLGEVELGKKVGAEIQVWTRVQISAFLTSVPEKKTKVPPNHRPQRVPLCGRSDLICYLHKSSSHLTASEMHSSMSVAISTFWEDVKNHLQGNGASLNSLTLKECFVFLSVLWSAVNTYSAVYCKYTIITTVRIHLWFNSYVNLC